MTSLLVTGLSEAYATIRDVPRLGAAVPFVARQDELAQLCEAYERARDGQATVVLVSGDAGVGKSRLLTEFSDHARAEGAVVTLGRSLSMADSGLPYLPFIEIAEQVRHIDDDVIASRPQLAVLVGQSIADVLAAPGQRQDLSQLQLFDAYFTAIAEVSQDRVVVLALEDLHWADASTRDLLYFLVSRLGRQKVLIVATYRADDLHRRHPLRPLLAELTRIPVVQRLDLQPFSPTTARAFVHAVGGDDIDELAVADIAKRSEGNAFYAEELLAAGATKDGTIPSALADVLLSRVEELSQQAHRVVGAISATGRYRVRHSILSRVIDIEPDELDEALREAVQHNILVASPDQDGYGFRHALLREAVYGDLLPGERVRLHAAYARIIKEDGDTNRAGMLAFHSVNSNNLPQALTASIQAADNAMRLGALADELAHVEKALELWHVVDNPEELTDVDELALTRKAAYVAAAAGYRERAAAYSKATIPLADERNDPLLEADVRRQLSYVLLAQDLWSEAQQTIGEAWERVKELPPSRERAWVLCILARSTEDYDLAGEYAAQAIENAIEVGAADARADGLVSLAQIAEREGDIDKSIRKSENARDAARETGASDVELRAIFNLTVSHYELGDLATAAEIVDQGVERTHELGLSWSPYGLELHWLAAMVHYHRGSWDESLLTVSQPGEAVSDTVTGLLAASRAMVFVGRGEFGDAARVLNQLRPEWHRDFQIPHLAAIAGAELSMWLGRAADAPVIIDEAIDAMRKRSGDEWHMSFIRLGTLATAAHADLADGARLQHAPADELAAIQAGEKFAEFVDKTVEHGSPRGAEIGPEGRAWLTRMRAELARLHGKHQPELWRAVVDAFGHGEIYHQAIARWRLAEALIAAGERDLAANELKAATETADKLSAKPLADAVQALARRARISMPGAAAIATDVLTAREGAVLALVAEGLTNRDIGARLFIADKTVSVHVSRIMAKLGASGRTEAVALAYQRGLLDPPGDR